MAGRCSHFNKLNFPPWCLIENKTKTVHLTFDLISKYLGYMLFLILITSHHISNELGQKVFELMSISMLLAWVTILKCWCLTGIKFPVFIILVSKYWTNRDLDLMVALNGKMITKLIIIHPSGDLDVSPRFHGDPFNSHWDYSLKADNVNRMVASLQED